MKNKLLLLVLFTFSFSMIGYAEVSTEDLSIPTDSILTEKLLSPDNITQSTAERLVDKYSGKIVEGFNSVVESATPVAKAGFEMAVRLQIAYGILGLLGIVAFIFFAKALGKEYKRISNILNSENVPTHMNERFGPMNEDNITLILILLFIATIITFIFAIVGIFQLPRLIAPEWFAIKEIIELFK